MRKRAFTLIELLLVISVIVMLMALLFPALQRARQNARAAVCLSRLHQSSLAFKMYTDSNEGRWFTADRDDDGRYGPQNWLGLVASYWFNTPGCMACPMATKGLGWPLRLGCIHRMDRAGRVRRCNGQRRIRSRPGQLCLQ